MNKETVRNALLFVAGSVLFLWAWSHFFPAPVAPPQPATQSAAAPAGSAPAAVASSAPGAAATPAPPASAPAGVPAGAAPPASAPVTTPEITAAVAEQFTLKSGDTAVVVTNQGAVATSWQLDGGVENHAKSVELIHPGQPLDPKKDNWSGSALQVAGEPAAAARQLNQALWRCAATPDAVTCDYSSGGLTAQKKLQLHDNLLHELTFTAAQNGAPLGLTLGWGPGFGRELSDDEMKNRLTAVVKINSFIAGDSRAKPIGFKKDDVVKTVPGPFVWYGVDDNFYGALFVPKTPVASLDAGQTESTRPASAEGMPSKNPTEMLPRVSGPFHEGFLFVGPKKFPALQKLGHGLEKACGYDSVVPGVTTATVYLYYTLIAIGGRVHSWGLAIILLTLLFRLALLPITFKSMVNMRVMQVKMKRIQKKVDDIRAKYKKKGIEGMTAMQEEMGKLYKKHGINQFGMLAGCLPVLLQMPLFFGFYNLLSRVIELKGQPFLHLHDLTAADPYYIMPVLSGTFMFISSWMSSKTVADQGQRMMLMISPLLFAFFFLYYPAGLSLYWAVSNLFTIGQQRLINHYGDKKVADERAKEKLRAELAGESD